MQTISAPKHRTQIAQPQVRTFRLQVDTMPITLLNT